MRSHQMGDSTCIAKRTPINNRINDTTNEVCWEFGIFENQDEEEEKEEEEDLPDAAAVH